MNRLHTKKKKLQKTNNQRSKTPWGKYKQGQVVDWGRGRIHNFQIKISL